MKKNRRIVPYDAETDPRDAKVDYFGKTYRMHNRRITIGVAQSGQIYIKTKRLIERQIHVSTICYTGSAVACILDALKDGHQRWVDKEATTS